MWSRFAVDMTKRDELDARIKAEREEAVEEIRSQVRAEVATEVCFVYATCVGESCPVD